MTKCDGSTLSPVSKSLREGICWSVGAFRGVCPGAAEFPAEFKGEFPAEFRGVPIPVTSKNLPATFRIIPRI